MQPPIMMRLALVCRLIASMMERNCELLDALSWGRGVSMRWDEVSKVVCDKR